NSNPPMKKTLAGSCLVVVLLTISHAQTSTPTNLHLPALDRLLPTRAELIYQQLSRVVDAKVAMETAAFIAPLWRLAGNPAFEASQQQIFDRLTAAGLKPRYETFPNSGMGWEQIRGTLRLGGPDGEVLLSRETHRVALAINSFSTAPGGATFRLVEDGKDVKDAVVLVSGPLGPAWQQAVRSRGAAGVISTDIAAYTKPESTPDVLQWGNIPFDETLKSFGLKATPRASARLRQALAAGPATVHVDIETVFHRRPNRTLVLEIPGRSKPEQRIVLAAHVQEPGANDNASGCGSLLAAALGINDAIRRGMLAAPDRTLTFLWVDEIRGSEQWIKQHAASLPQVVAMLSLDMTGQDTTKTGGTFLIEKQPDPSALWDRPSDPHSEWGAGKVDPAWVRGSFLNDLHLGVALRRARDSGWVVRTNPYEGGSDHTVFTRAGVPALLNWHFTDRYYHTNLDTADKMSAAEMQHVAIVVATTATFLASADRTDVEALRAMMTAARHARMETERKNSATTDILEAWHKWYDEALASVDRLAR
ncbi:MAG TPA: M28 family peptidase, partial [Vicinamibacterales bacterium]|nr:M28 family peptidase [Vicinamibacterales bacterium]